jgi:mono/diheme cytochrome c family protein
MNRLQLIVICAGAIWIAAGCQTESPKSASATPTPNSVASSSTPDQYANARVLYAKDCLNCHGAKGEGGRVKLDDGTTIKVPTLLAGHALRHKDDEYIKQITKGGDGMPAFDGKLTPDQMNELVRFIRHEFQGK